MHILDLVHARKGGGQWRLGTRLRRAQRPGRSRRGSGKADPYRAGGGAPWGHGRGVDPGRDSEHEAPARLDPTGARPTMAIHGGGDPAGERD